MSDHVVTWVNWILQALSIAIIVRALMSWFDPTYKSAVGRIVYDFTEPIVGPIRRVMPAIGMFDLSPIVALVLLQLLERLLTASLT